MSSKTSNQSGQSLLELLVAMGIFVLVIASTMFLTLDAHLANQEGGQRTRAAALAQEGMEASKSLASRGWKYLTVGTHGLSAVTNVWQYNGAVDSLGIFSRAVTVASVNRDVSGNITTSGGALDLDTKLVTSQVTWSPRPNRPSSVIVNSYMTNWKSRRWIQTQQADFDAGTKNQVVSANISGGELELASAGGGTLGNKFKIDTSVATQRLNNTTNRISFRFTAQNSKTVNSIRVFIHEKNGTGNTSFRYGLQGDNSGNPSGTWLASADLALSGTVATNNWQSLTLSSTYTIIAGTVYHLVVQPVPGTSPAPNGSRYISLRVTTPLNAMIPLSNNPDLQSNVLYYTGSWQLPINRQPIYVLGFTDATFEGDPYISLTEVNQERIFGGNYVGEQFTPGSTVTAAAVTFEAKKIGAPAGNLMVALYDVSGSSLVEQGVLSAAGSVGTSYGSFTYTFTSPRTLSFGATYRVYVFSSVANNNSNYFRIRRLEVTNNAVYRNISYNAVVSFLTRSANSGGSWTPFNQADIGGYYFTLQSSYQLTGDFISSAFDTGSANTVDNYLAWTSTVPVGTTLQYQVRTAATQVELASATWVGPDGTGATFFTTAGDIIADNANTRWIQYRAHFTSTGAATPTLSDITVNYE
ncbi:MAG: prepilin-type N-terminal cleavage/methylation domain-containing protein [Patescibacteria group bacterium]